MCHMRTRTTLGKVLAILGTVLLALPILFMLITSSIFTVRTSEFRMDFLIPGELFFVVLAGGLALLWATIRSRTMIKCIAWLLGIGLVMLFGGQGIAMLTGLASGRIDNTSPWMIVVTAMIICYDICVLLMAICGVKLICNLFHTKASS